MPTLLFQVQDKNELPGRNVPPTRMPEANISRSSVQAGQREETTADIVRRPERQTNVQCEESCAAEDCQLLFGDDENEVCEWI